MSLHPSLNAKFVAPEPTRCVAKMFRNAPCWCKSGKKYKVCHYDREKMTPKNIFQIEEEMLQELRQGYCSYPQQLGDECSSGVSKAHTVQRRGGLTAISEAGHVLTVKPSMKGMIEHEGMPPPRRIGVKQASVFPGFCNKHDAKIFKPIEGTQVELDKSSAMLFAYRAIAYERFSKEAQLRITNIQKESDRGQSLRKQAFIQQHLNDVRWGIEIGMADTEAWKNDYDSRIISGDLNDFYFYAVKFDQVLPLVGCCAFYPEFDLQGNVLQRLARTGFKFDHLTLSITSFLWTNSRIFRLDWRTEWPLS